MGWYFPHRAAPACAPPGQAPPPTRLRCAVQAPPPRIGPPSPCTSWGVCNPIVPRVKYRRLCYATYDSRHSSAVHCEGLMRSLDATSDSLGMLAHAGGFWFYLVLFLLILIQECGV